MSKHRTSWFAALAALTWSGHAFAAGNSFSAGTFAIGGERLSGFYHSSITATQDTPFGQIKISDTTDHFTLLTNVAGGTTGGTGTTNISSSYADIPRLGLDFFVIDGLSLGGTLGIDHTALGSPTASGPGVNVTPQNAGGSITTWLFSPRVGYVFMFNDSIGIWPRGGLAYYHTSVSPDQGYGSSLHFFSLDLEAPFIFALTNGFAITAGPLFEISLDGSTSSDNPNVSASTGLSYTTFGISVGLLGWI